MPARRSTAPGGSTGRGRPQGVWCPRHPGCAFALPSSPTRTSWPSRWRFGNGQQPTAYCTCCPMGPRPTTGAQRSHSAGLTRARPEQGQVIDEAIVSVGSVGLPMAPPSYHRRRPRFLDPHRKTSIALDRLRSLKRPKVPIHHLDAAGGGLLRHRLARAESSHCRFLLFDTAALPWPHVGVHLARVRGDPGVTLRSVHKKRP